MADVMKFGTPVEIGQLVDAGADDILGNQELHADFSNLVGAPLIDHLVRLEQLNGGASIDILADGFKINRLRRTIFQTMGLYESLEKPMSVVQGLPRLVGDIMFRSLNDVGNNPDNDGILPLVNLAGQYVNSLIVLLWASAFQLHLPSLKDRRTKTYSKFGHPNNIEIAKNPLVVIKQGLPAKVDFRDFSIAVRIRQEMVQVFNELRGPEVANLAVEFGEAAIAALQIATTRTMPIRSYAIPVIRERNEKPAMPEGSKAPRIEDADVKKLTIIEAAVDYIDMSVLMSEAPIVKISEREAKSHSFNRFIVHGDLEYTFDNNKKRQFTGFGDKNLEKYIGFLQRIKDVSDPDEDLMSIALWIDEASESLKRDDISPDDRLNLSICLKVIEDCITPSFIRHINNATKIPENKHEGIGAKLAFLGSLIK